MISIVHVETVILRISTGKNSAVLIKEMQFIHIQQFCNFFQIGSILFIGRRVLKQVSCSSGPEKTNIAEIVGHSFQFGTVLGNQLFNLPEQLLRGFNHIVLCLNNQQNVIYDHKQKQRGNNKERQPFSYFFLHNCFPYVEFLGYLFCMSVLR